MTFEFELRSVIYTIVRSAYDATRVAYCSKDTFFVSIRVKCFLKIPSEHTCTNHIFENFAIAYIPHIMLYKVYVVLLDMLFDLIGKLFDNWVYSV